MSSYGRGPPQIDGMSSLKVDNLTYRTTPEDLRIAFEKYGKVGDVYIPRDRFTRESRGFAFVRFHDKRDSEDALDCMDGATMDGRELRVQMARYGRPQEPRRAMRRGGGGGGYGGRSSRHSYRSRSRSRSYERRRHSRRSRSSSRNRRGSRHSKTRSRSKSRSYSRSHSGSHSRSRSFSRSKSRSRSRSRYDGGND